jgi:hypothetical protein
MSLTPETAKRALLKPVPFEPATAVVSLAPSAVHVHER